MKTSAFALTVGLFLAATTGYAQPSLRAEGDTLVASDVTPGGAVHWIGATRQLHGGYISMVNSHHATVVDEDGDGAVTYRHHADIPTLSVWAAVDGESGELTVFTPEDFDPGDHAPATTRWERTTDDDARFQLSGFRYEVLLVRPGEGAWSGEIVDGGPADADGERDGLLTLTGKGLASAAQNGPEAPDSLREGDVAVFVDRRMLWAFITRLDLDESTPEEGGLGR